MYSVVWWIVDVSQDGLMDSFWCCSFGCLGLGGLGGLGPPGAGALAGLGTGRKSTMTPQTLLLDLLEYLPLVFSLAISLFFSVPSAICCDDIDNPTPLPIISEISFFHSHLPLPSTAICISLAQPLRRLPVVGSQPYREPELRCTFISPTNAGCSGI